MTSARAANNCCLPRNSTVRWGWLVLACLPLAAACRPAEPPGAAAPTADSLGVAELQRESWNVVTLMGSRIGYEQYTHAWFEQQGERMIRTTSHSVIRVVRSGDSNEQTIDQTVDETEDGTIVRLECTWWQAAQPVRSVAHVRDGKLAVVTTAAGNEQRSELPWTADNGGYFVVERSLLRAPMQPGERRTMTGLLAPFNQLAQVELTAGDWEMVDVAGQPRRLLRIDCVQTVSGAPPIRSVRWSDDEGDLLRGEIPSMKMVFYRSTRADALSAPTGEPLDLNEAAMVRIDHAVDGMLTAASARYRVTLEESDPASLFARGGGQTIVPLDERTIELSVRPVRIPGAAEAAAVGPAPQSAPDEPPTDAERLPSVMLQSDNPRIVQLARQAVGDATSDADKAVRLERFVHAAMQQVNFSQAFATAAEVADSLAGDCTEHAVLLAAMARAEGLPARVAVGLVYIHPRGGPAGFGYHMWTEVYVDGHWVGLDATLGRGGISPGHLKASHSDLASPDGQAGLLSVISLIGQLHIEVLKVE